MYCTVALKCAERCHATVKSFIVRDALVSRIFCFGGVILKNRTLLTVIMAVIIVAVLATVFIWGGDPNAMSPCEACEGAGSVAVSDTELEICEVCEGSGEVAADTPYFSTWTALLAPVIAIVLALVTKEVYSSLFIGIVVGGLLSAKFNVVSTVDNVVQKGIISAVSDTAGIFAFLVILGIMVALVNKAGGSAAFGRWAKVHIKSKVGAVICTFILGVLIFIDDYFNCLTVGSVMRPVTDTHKISRAKLAYIIDATAAPVCMIAPISSWAAAVSSYAADGQGIKLFIQAIPYNLYSLLSFVFIIAITLMKFDFGPMKKFEAAAENGDLGALDTETESKDSANPRGRVIDLILPVAVLVVTCIWALIYNGGFFDTSGEYYMDFVGAFSNTDATVGLPLGGIIALVFTVIYMMLRRTVTFGESMSCVPKGFIAMVPAILILTMATSLKNMTGLLGAKYFVAGLMDSAAQGLAAFLPAIIFLVAVGLAFATGTSWGTFGILIPIVSAIFTDDPTLLIIGISACLAGAVCGDHCSPISDTTIMSSAGAQCEHVNHVSTQLPYALMVAAVSFVGYILFAFIRQWFIVLPVMAVIMIAVLFVIKKLQKKA